MSWPSTSVTQEVYVDNLFLVRTAAAAVILVSVVKILLLYR